MPVKKQTVTLFGIKNCDTMKKARTWLEAQEIAYQFHDYKISSIERTQLEAWCKQIGWEVLLNRAGTMFKKLPDVNKINLTEHKAIELMLLQPSMIKRPVLMSNKQLLVGFKPEVYATFFAK